MILATIFALSLVQQGPALVCPVTFEAANSKVGGSAEYAGAKVTFCCGMCAGDFKQSPDTILANAAEKSKVVALYLFDPVSGGRVPADKAKAFSDYRGIRFPFGTEEDKKAFDAEPKKFGLLPAKEALFCPVERHSVASHAAAGGFVDFEGVRYYTCCDDCLMQMRMDPGKYAPNAAKYVQKVKVTEVKGN